MGSGAISKFQKSEINFLNFTLFTQGHKVSSPFLVI